MTNPPPTKKNLQSTFVKTALRLPASLRDELAAAAELAGHSLNDEILARCLAQPVRDKIDSISAENAQLKAMMREMLDSLPTRR